ncbi:hypothetical protein [Nonomuraea sp. NPDC003709]|uniref:hypothetical protein n=1 Tax=Nonomuraea sp. NPDC003709 TaxID=3154450 RepID=UPI0033A6F860
MTDGAAGRFCGLRRSLITPTACAGSPGMIGYTWVSTLQPNRWAAVRAAARALAVPPSRTTVSPGIMKDHPEAWPSSQAGARSTERAIISATGVTMADQTPGD